MPGSTVQPPREKPTLPERPRELRSIEAAPADQLPKPRFPSSKIPPVEFERGEWRIKPIPAGLPQLESLFNLVCDHLQIVNVQQGIFLKALDERQLRPLLYAQERSLEITKKSVVDSHLDWTIEGREFLALADHSIKSAQKLGQSLDRWSKGQPQRSANPKLDAEMLEQYAIYLAQNIVQMEHLLIRVVGRKSEIEGDYQIVQSSQPAKETRRKA